VLAVRLTSQGRWKNAHLNPGSLLTELFQKIHPVTPSDISLASEYHMTTPASRRLEMFM
jgi:hypothetical protein